MNINIYNKKKEFKFQKKKSFTMSLYSQVSLYNENLLLLNKLNIKRYFILLKAKTNVQTFKISIKLYNLIFLLFT